MPIISGPDDETYEASRAEILEVARAFELFTIEDAIDFIERHVWQPSEFDRLQAAIARAYIIRPSLQGLTHAAKN